MFGGAGHKLGGGGAAAPGKDMYRSTHAGGPKKVITAEGKIGVAKGATDSVAERERRAAAAEARVFGKSAAAAQ